MGIMRYLFILFLVFLTSCGKYYLSMCQQKVDATYLASFGAHTPDPRLENPPMGQQLIIDWRIPPRILKKNPTINLDVIYKNHTQKSFEYPIHKRMGWVTYNLLDKEFEKKKGILSYRAELVTEDGKVYKSWVHQLWVKLITFNEESSESAQEINSSVEDQSKHGSVIETP